MLLKMIKDFLCSNGKHTRSVYYLNSFNADVFFTVNENSNRVSSHNKNNKNHFNKHTTQVISYIFN